MYCPECGYKIEEEDARFCPECGTKVSEDVQPQHGGAEEESRGLGELVLGPGGDGVVELATAAVKCVWWGWSWFSGRIAEKKVAAKRFIPKEVVQGTCGIIFTNVKLLALKLGTNEKAIVSLLEDFIVKKQSSGVFYQLVDVGNYTYLKSNVLKQAKTVHLDGGSDLWDYMDILMDIHDYEHDNSYPESQYLFIIGGDDIIPMPRIRHYLADMEEWSDKDIETDMLYAYPYSPDMRSKMETQEIFVYDQLFHVGRLPMGTDTTLDDFSGYLNRCIAWSEKGIPMQRAYIQCDPNWKRMTATASRVLLEGGWLRNLGQLPAEKYFHGMILSPGFQTNDISQVFDREASLFFFNLHGSNVKGYRGYLGEFYPQTKPRRFAEVVMPEHLNTCRFPNVIFSGACYGARFIGKDRWHSMLLSSIYRSTLLFIGSSRTAMGGREQNTPHTYASIALGDVMTKGFLDTLMSGKTAGEALLEGRKLCYGQHEGDPKYAMTIVEFNLFGDPTLFLSVPNSMNNASHSKMTDASVCRIAESRECGCIMEKVSMPSDISSLSILERVRRKVDENIIRIHDSIGHQLYQMYGMEPRQASSVYRMKYADGTRDLSFNYCVEQDSPISGFYNVRTTEDGQIISVSITK